MITYTQDTDEIVERLFAFGKTLPDGMTIEEVTGMKIFEMQGIVKMYVTDSVSIFQGTIWYYIR